MNSEEIFERINSQVNIYHEDGWVYICLPSGRFKTRHPPLLAQIKNQLDTALTELIDFKMAEHGVPWLDMICDGSEPPEVYDINGNRMGCDEEVPEDRPENQTESRRPS